MNSKHATSRSQQRGIPPFIHTLLDIYGHEAYDGHGSVVLYFDKNSRRRMEHDMGREPVRKLAEWHDSYKVVSIGDGCTITVGRRYARIRRK